MSTKKERKVQFKTKYNPFTLQYQRPSKNIEGKKF